MSMVKLDLFPRSMLDMDTWFRPTLDIFDPFDEIDRMIGRNIQWLTRPSFLEPMPLMPRVPRKYRITVDCAGYNPTSLKTDIQGKNLIVTGKEDIKEKTGDFSSKEFRKTYKLPDNTETDKLVSFVTPMGQLVVEVPLKVERGTMEQDLMPQITDTKEGGKMVTMKCTVPQGVDPNKMTVTVKDRDLIIKAEDVQEKPDTVSRMFYYKRCTLPETTDVNALKCHLEGTNQLKIEAPMNPTMTTQRTIPIEGRK